jgi:hypothetical protein
LADKKITELPVSGSSLLDTDVFPLSVNVATSPETRKIAKSDLRNAMQIPTPQNFLINGGFDFAQRQAPGTQTTIATDKYSADRWRTSSQSASLQYLRQVNGSTSYSNGYFQQITNAGKFMIYQIVEGICSYSLRSDTVTFSIRLAGSVSKTIRMGIIELNSSGTVDTIPATFVTSWNANSSDPTLGANLAYIGTPVSQSVTTLLSQFSISVTLPSTSKNFIVAVWTDSQFSANDILYTAEAGLYLGNIPTPTWNPRPISEEFAMCQRYYQKSYDKDTAIATTTPNGLILYTVITPVANGGTYGTVRYPVSLRTASTPVIYGYQGGVNKVTLTSSATDQGANSGVATFQGETGFTAYNNSGSSLAGNQFEFHFYVDSEL